MQQKMVLNEEKEKSTMQQKKMVLNEENTVQREKMVLNEEKTQTEILHELFNDAPFGLYKVNDTYHLTCGKYRKEFFKDQLDNLVDFINKTNWEVIGMYITAIIEQSKQNTNI